MIREIELPISHENSRGKTVSINFDSVIPFEVKRTYYMWNIPMGSIRASGALINEKGVFICLRGRCAVKVSEDGSPPHKIIMNSSSRGIFIGQMVWHEFIDFSPDAIVLCLSSSADEGNNKITRFEDFTNIKNQKKRFDI